MPLQILPLLISPWPKHPQKLEKMEVECRSLNIASLQSNIKWSLKLCRYLSTHLCRDESLMKNLIVITLNLSGKKEKVSHNTFISVFIFFTLGGGFGGFFCVWVFFIIVIVWGFSCRKNVQLFEHKLNETRWRGGDDCKAWWYKHMQIFVE